MSSPKYFGCHVSAAGGLENALKNGQELGVNTIQLHASPPQQWNTKPSPAGAESKFLALRQESGVEKVFFHAIYLINLATPDPKKLQLAKLSLLNALELMGRIRGDGVIFHVGSMKDQPDEAAGFKQVAESIDWIMEESTNDARLILEVAAGSGSIIGDRMEELARIYEQVKFKERVGFGLDTQHMWASGYDLRNDLAAIVDEVKTTFGIDKVWSIHLNDSKTELASKKDRHENLGDGLIGSEALTNFLRHPAFEEIPFILETPAMKSLEEAKVEVKKLRAMAGK